MVLKRGGPGQEVQAVTVIAAAAMVLAAAGALLHVAEQSAHAQQPESRTIGIIVIHDNSAIVERMERTFMVALEDFNGKLAEDGRDWRLAAEFVTIPHADGTTDAINGLNAKGIKAVAGFISDAGVANAYRPIHQNGMIVITSSSGLPEFSRPDNIFRTASTYDTVADAFVNIMQSEGKTEIINLFLDFRVGQTFNSTIYETLEGIDGMSMLGSVKFGNDIAGDAARIGTEMSRILRSTDNHENVGIFVTGIPSSAGVLGIMAGLDRGSDSAIGKTTFYGTGTLQPGIEGSKRILQFMEKTGYKGVETAIHENELNIRLDSLLGNALATLTYDAYSTVQILGRAIDSAGSATDTAAIRQGMQQASLDYSPVSARGINAAFDRNGDAAERDVHISEIRDGKFVTTQEYDPDHGITQPAPFSEPDRRKLGAIVSETGDLAGEMVAASTAISLAVSDFNIEQFRAGTDYRIDLIKRDDGTDPSRTAQQARAIEELGSNVIVGPAHSGGVGGIVSLDSDNIIAVSYGSGSPEFSIPDDNIFRVLPDNVATSRAYAEMLEHDGIENTIIVYRDDAWGRMTSEAMYNAFAERTNVTLIDGVAYTPGTADYSTVTDRLADALGAAGAGGAPSTAVVLLAFDEEDDIMRSAASDSRLQEGRWYGIFVRSQADNAGIASWIENVGYTTVTTKHEPNALNARIDSEIPGANIYTYHAYDTTKLLIEVLQKEDAVTGSVPLARASSGIYQNTVEPTALGVPLVFNENGDLDANSINYSIYRTTGGESVLSLVFDSASETIKSAKPSPICR
ncbi:MAG: ABC transporter substrate-binding protein [Nitrosopumilaceae archaeon]|nr:ABC transporter substrate-binding protein [Nitrosopumilaceae archaeon]